MFYCVLFVSTCFLYVVSHQLAYRLASFYKADAVASFLQLQLCPMQKHILLALSIESPQWRFLMSWIVLCHHCVYLSHTVCVESPWESPHILCFIDCVHWLCVVSHIMFLESPQWRLLTNWIVRCIDLCICFVHWLCVLVSNTSAWSLLHDTTL